MKRQTLARLVASQTHVSNAMAKDRVDELVCQILRSLRKDRAVELPGICKLIANAKKGAR